MAFEMFAKANDKSYNKFTEMAVVGNVKASDVQTKSDNGITQSVQTSKGIVLKEDTELPNPVVLAPFRTFVEIEQVSSAFIFRAKGEPYNTMLSQIKHFRQRMIKYLQNHTVTETAIRFKVSRKTVYKWLKRYDGTIESLCDRSHRPHKMPKAHSEQELKLIRRLAKKHKWTDLILVYQELKERYNYTRSYGGLKRVISKMKAQRAEKKKCKRKPKPYKRADYIGQKIQIDVKFVPSYCVTNGKKYYEYIAVDECSRWAYRQMYDEHSTYSSYQFLISLIKNAPFPIREVQTDNGTEFTNALLVVKAKHKTMFEEALEKLNIKYHRIRVATPRHNGKVERQNRQDEERFYKYMRMYSLEDGRKQLAVYQKKSNNYIKTCLNFQSPNQVVEKYLGVM